MSTVDWDFQQGTTYRSLTTAKYISAPKCLYFHADTTKSYNVILSRQALCQNLPEGEVRNWVWKDQAQTHLAVFRNQAALGSANYTNTYMLYFESGALKLWRYVAGSGAQRAYCGASLPYNDWNEIRTVWWNGLTPFGVACLSVAAYARVGAVWTPIGVTLQCTQNSWKDSAINRCGFLENLVGNHDSWYDDTEIWGP